MQKSEPQAAREAQREAQGQGEGIAIASPQHGSFVQLQSHIAASPRVIQQRRQADRIQHGQQPVQRFAPGPLEIAPTDAELDTLLGAGQDPGGCRAIITAASPSLVSLTTAVASIVNTAPTVAHRRVLAPEVGNVEVLVPLLALATHPNGIGTPAPRLMRVLEENPTVARTVVGLTPAITYINALDEKITSGALPGNPPIPATLAAGTAAVGPAARGIIGGHSSRVTGAGYVSAPHAPVNANGTQVIDFQKATRDDAGTQATAVSTAAVGNVGTRAVDAADRARLLAHAVVAPVLPGNYATLPLQGQQFHTNRVATHASNLTNVDTAHGAVAGLYAAAVTAAGLSAATPNDVALRKAFVDSVLALVARADSTCSTAKTVTGAAAINNAQETTDLATAKALFQTHGPAFSDVKQSTIAPAAWTDDQVLDAGHQAIMQPAVLVNPDNPPNNSVVRTKHQAVVGGVLWVAIKERVTFTNVPPYFAGGEMTSSWPTAGTAIPAAPGPGVADPDSFYTYP